ncbi:MAG TPA: DUF4445 domain-containing protein, partial [Candidatus Hydrogenedentes bacterium]|nr:DUF4445 domain-containing protein [Candidatus Hydrogenedentota bacterium]
CILATDIASADGLTVLVDIGTNGEIVVAHGGRLLASSTAAGPAFEGARISSGMRAAAGAIEHLTIDEDLRIEVIGDGRPTGICGSALIDLAAEMLRAGIMGPDGVLATPDAPSFSRIPPAVADRLVQDHDGPVLVLAHAAESRTEQPILFTQRDVRELQLATGAIRSGVSILLKRVGLSPEDVDRVLVAGAFGNYIRRENAQRIGLLPREVPAERIVFVGNASLAGALMALGSQKVREKAESVARSMEHVDLSLDPDFQMAFAMAMQFPEKA